MHDKSGAHVLVLRTQSFHGVAPNRGAVRYGADFRFGKWYGTVRWGAGSNFILIFIRCGGWDALWIWYGAVQCGKNGGKTARYHIAI